MATEITKGRINPTENWGLFDEGTYTLGSGETEYDSKIWYWRSIKRRNYREDGQKERFYDYKYYGTVQGNSLDNIIYGSEGHKETTSYLGHEFEKFTIGAQPETLKGGAGNDIIYGRAGNDTIYGGQHNDYLYGGAGVDSIHGGSGNDVLFSGVLEEVSDHNSEQLNDSLSGGSGADVFVLGAPSDEIVGGELPDFSALSGLATDATGLILTAGTLGAVDAVSHPVSIIKGLIPMVVKLAKGDFSGSSGTPFVPTQYESAKYLTVEDFSALEDVVVVPISPNGSANVDVSYNSGKTIDLKYLNGSTFAKLNLANNYGGNSGDVADSLLQSAFILNSDGTTVNIGANTENGNIINQETLTVTSQGDLGARYLVLGAYGPQLLKVGNGDHKLYGSNYGDTFIAYETTKTTIENQGTTVAPGDDGNDELYGYGGDDIFFAGGGVNYVYGGDGSDIISYDDANNFTLEDNGDKKGITVDLSATQSDTNGTFSKVTGAFISSETDTGENQTLSVDKLYSIENVIGSDFDDIFTGDGSDNTLAGGGGNDTLEGLSGNDTLVGGFGNDTYKFDTDSYLGTDTIREVQNVALETVHGTYLQAMNGGSVRQWGLVGVQEQFTAEQHGDKVALKTHHDTYLQAMNDRSVRQWGLVGVQEQFTVEQHDDKVALKTHHGEYMQARSDGSVRQWGWVGAQEQFTVHELGSSGTDTLDFSDTTSKSVTVDLSQGSEQTVNENLKLRLDSDLLVSIENVVGGQQGDTLTGNAKDNVLDGRLGDDTLIGGGGNDILIAGDATATVFSGDHNNLNGGSGNDTLIADYSNDTLIGGAGADTFVFNPERLENLGLGVENIIQDFNANEDIIQLDVDNPTLGLSDGASVHFDSSTSNLLIYNPMWGQLLQVATLKGVSNFDVSTVEYI